MATTDPRTRAVPLESAQIRPKPQLYKGEHNTMNIKFYQKLMKYLPPKLKYVAAIDVIAYATTGKYGKTVVPELTAMDAIGRYGKDKDVES